MMCQTGWEVCLLEFGYRAGRAGVFRLKARFHSACNCT